MSIGNLKDQGNKGNNFPYQLRTLQLLAQIDASVNAIPGVDFVTRTTTYSVTNANPGQYNLGDILVRYDIIDIVTNLVVSTIWFNQTQGTNLLVAPLVGDYVPITPPSTVFVGNLGGGNAVNIQDGGNSITVDGVFWQATQPVSVASLPLPAGAATETTLGAVNTKLTSSARTPNLIRATGIGTIALQVYSFSVANVGSLNGTILGQTIKPGETLNFDAGDLNNYYTAGTISYNGTGTELLIIYNS